MNDISQIDIAAMRSMIGSLEDGSEGLLDAASRLRSRASYHGLAAGELRQITDIGQWTQEELPGLRERLRLAEAIEASAGDNRPVVNLSEAAFNHELTDPVTQRAFGGGVDVSATVVVTLETGENVLVEELSDGRFRVTDGQGFAAGAGVGVGLEAGVIIDGKEYGIGASASADVMLSFKQGTTYYFDDLAEVQRFLVLNGATTIALNMSPVLRPFHPWIKQQTPWTPEADEWFAEVGVEGQGQIRAMGIINTIGGEAAVGAYLGGTYRRDGTATVYLRGTAEWAAGVHTIPGDVEAGFALDGEVLVELDLDADGNPTALRFQAAGIGEAYVREQGETILGTDDPRYVELTYELPIDWPADAELIGDTLSSLEDPTSPMAATAADRLTTEIAERGFIYRDTYALGDSEFGAFANGQVKGLDVGGSAGLDTVQRQHLSREYRHDGVWVSSNP
ncbi:hypothetical protein [Phytoactinopolyspora mesophila]|uniref:Uncharacterized protein n=1 Tax=Phytoactinopolyspora mesophila TaxID=2650750 RepID=A0A7K3LXE2_9ACTN|nr:hypothetical protein [Phytoactinopolyspora mesophila]NDL55683.1 hypothetical protein [Phytoactinopolyspora mesophila]